MMSLSMIIINGCAYMPSKSCQIVGDNGIEVHIECSEPTKEIPSERYNTCKFDHEYEENDCTLVA